VPDLSDSRAESTEGHVWADVSSLSWPEVARRSGVPLAEIRRTEQDFDDTAQKTCFRVRLGSTPKNGFAISAPTDIALTFADYLSVKNQMARRFSS